MKTHIQDKIVRFLKEYHHIELDSATILEESFTGGRLKLSGSDLYRLMMWLEEEYKIYIPPDLVRKEGFRTIHQAAALIEMIMEDEDEKNAFI